jgi:hypothetical protein
LRLLADKLVELEIVEEKISYQTLRRTLKKMNQTAPEETVVHPTTGERRICVEDGGCAGGPHPPL